MTVTLPRLAFGTQGWSYPDWAGSLYTAGSRPNAYLGQYAAAFGSVEVDSTFYGTPPPQRLMRWSRAVPPSFTFALKLVREVTHERRLVGSAVPVAEFFASARHLGPQLEAVLVQLPPDFGPGEWPALEAFIPLLPADVRVAIELRDPHWFAPAPQARLSALLRKHGVALAVTDSPFVELNLMLAAFVTPTASFGYIRWLGQRNAVSRFDRATIDRGARIARWSAALRTVGTRLERVCGYANNEFMGHAPATVRAMYRSLGIEQPESTATVQMELFSPSGELEEH